MASKKTIASSFTCAVGVLVAIIQVKYAAWLGNHEWILPCRAVLLDSSFRYSAAHSLSMVPLVHEELNQGRILELHLLQDQRMERAAPFDAIEQWRRGPYAWTQSVASWPNQHTATTHSDRD